MLIYVIEVILSEMATDALKHFFVTRLNKIDTQQYKTFRKNLINLYNKKDPSQFCGYLKEFNWELHKGVFDFESVIGLSTNFMIMP